MPDQLRTLVALGDALVHATESAAISAYDQVGRGNEKEADQAAVDAMRNALNQIQFKGRIVIGEGERDEAPMLYMGEEVGTGEGPAIDIALDPLEGTTLTAKSMPNALCVLAAAPRGTLLHAPDVYMEKVAVGPGFPEDILDLDVEAAEIARRVAAHKGVEVSEITACVLDRPRHRAIIESLREAGVRIALITDGDVAGIIYTTLPETGIDFYIGSGGAPEGVLAASALNCVGGQMLGRLVFREDAERRRAEKAGIEDLNRIYTIKDMCTDETVFCATGVTQGSLMGAVRVERGHIVTESLVMQSASHTVRRILTRRPL